MKDYAFGCSVRNWENDPSVTTVTFGYVIRQGPQIVLVIHCALCTLRRGKSYPKFKRSFSQMPFRLNQITTFIGPNSEHGSILTTVHVY